MADSTKTDSKEHLAYELLQLIVSKEQPDKLHMPDARTYYLTLFRQCHLAVSGNSINTILAVNKAVIKPWANP